MKRIYILIVVLSLASAISGQAPLKFKYQAVLRNARGDVRFNSPASIVIDIMKGSSDGTIEYSETHSVSTDRFGIINLEIGNGTPVTGTMQAIDWISGVYYIRMSVDGKDMGSGQLLSVPFAMFANSSANDFTGSWNELTDKPALFSGSYTDLTDKPGLFDGTWGSLTGKPTFSTVAATGSYLDLTERPAFFDGDYYSLNNLPVLFGGSWSGLTGKPTTLAGYGITDAFNGTWSALTGKPTTLSGYGITDAFDGTWSALTGTPTTLSGYGITDAFDGTWSALTGTPTTLSGYGITDSFNGTWSALTGTPTTLSGYGITDSFNGTWSALTGTPTTVSGYGITDFDFTGALSGDLLQFDGEKWIRFSPGYALTDHSHADATSSLSGYMSAPDKAKLDTLTEADGSETKVNAGTNITVTGTGTSTNPYVVKATEHYVGENYGGGIVFYVYDGGLHGLIAAEGDNVFFGEGIDSTFKWTNSDFYIDTGTTGDGLGAGSMNTAMIVAVQITYALSFEVSPTEFAAKICADYESIGLDTITYGDWYLPSKYELDLLYQQKSVVGGFQDDYYWSSTESSYYDAYFQNFLDGMQYDSWEGSSKLQSFRVRAIRAF